ncbi:FadR/GntR family transcriptional regulator [Dictyobacter alpinus]|nr:FadR/GntR family transcriptional regulator [Dictyobacter alpinus]
MKPTAKPAYYQPAYQTVAAKITEFIDVHKLKAGDRLPTEQQLCLQLGVSRTVVREAIKVLVTTGQVFARKGSGLYVADALPAHAATIASIDIPLSIEPSQMHHLFEFRKLLEIHAAGLAAEQITYREVRAIEELLARHKESAEQMDLVEFDRTDNAFHQTIAQATRNPFLIASISKVTQLQSWAIHIILAGITPGSLRLAVEQHHEIFEAITRSNRDAATQAMRTHIQTVEECYEQEVRRRLHASNLAPDASPHSPTNNSETEAQ